MNNHYVKRVLKVLVYIEDHIDDEMTLEELARVAAYSPFHFHRIFQAIVGETAHKYVRRLRLEKAASRLRHTKKPITDIALDASFDTSSAFTRVFKQCMGEAPRNYRLLYKEVNAMTQKITELPMVYPDAIEKIADISTLCIRRYGNYAMSPEQAFHALDDFVEENNLDRAKLRYFSIAPDDPTITSEEKLRFDACIQAPAGVQEKGEVVRKTIKGGKCAIFTHHGPYSTLDEFLDRIFLKWLPDSEEDFDDTRMVFDELCNLEYINIDPSKLVTKLYIPLA